jgi:predicted P-loop ATPase
MRYGASPEAWQWFANHLDLKVDLLPVVSNPDAEISDKSKMQGIGKTPSLYNRDGKAFGFSEWTGHFTSNGHLSWWMKQPDYGICVQTRQLGAFDIDVPDEVLSDDVLGFGFLPRRWRDNSGKMLLAFRRDFELYKRVIPVEGGIVEVLGTGQQFVAVGQHDSGVLYQWNDCDEWPEEIPAITEEQFNKVWDQLVLLHATGEPKIARSKRERTNSGSGSDDVSKWLADNWECLGNGEDGRLYIECPFAGEHTTDSGPSSTAYFPAGTGGYERGHFVCLHAHCVGREDSDFLASTGYNVAQFENLDDPSDPAERQGDRTSHERVPTGQSTGLSVERSEVALDAIDSLPQFVDAPDAPRLVRTKAGDIEASALNLVKAIHHGGAIGRWVAYDAFTDELVWADRRHPIDGKTVWRRLADAEVTYIRMQFEQRGMKKLGSQVLRESLFAAGKLRTMDSAQEWLSRLRWDGVERIERFAVDVWGWADTPYAHAVGLYVWTALAGRVIEPGVQADMAPILVGLQGIRKTSAIKAMAPHPDMYTEIRLDAKDDDQSRSLRGKLIGEIEELRGLNSRAIEEIKAFVSRRRESWIPKFKEFENHFDRRCLLIGTTNETEFLADPTGERRWLPGLCQKLDIDLLRETRDQLWAEGAHRFIMDGVLWQEAERLAEKEHPRFKISDSWEKTIGRYLDGVDDELSADPLAKGYVTEEEIMLHALFISSQHQNRGHQIRVQKALRALGLRRQEDGSWAR